MSLYPILWAVEHAPVADAAERAILSALVMKGSFDGRDCHRSYPTLAGVARIDARTAERKCKEMERRGILRRQTGPKPQSWKRLPADKKTVIWEVMIPAEFWSATQLAEINQARAERGLVPITPENRPPLGPPPPKKTRADKGKKAPQRRPKSLPPKDDGSVQQEDKSPKAAGRPDSQSGRSEDSDRILSPVATGFSVRSRPDSQSTNPPFNPPPKTSPPSSPVSHTRTTSARAGAAPSAQGGGEAPSEETSSPVAAGTVPVPRPAGDGVVKGLEAACELLRGLPAPVTPGRSAAERLAPLVASALEDGWTPAALADHLTADLPARVISVRALLTHRLDDLPPPPASEGARRPYGPRCDDPRHDPMAPHDRLLHEPGRTSRRCPVCHPDERVNGVAQ
ncbi:hypothetical protein ACFY4C_41120 [Actinomadura viridis]|uniref:hypothetical protein n=1 Tax=Actinomadura viridis TaxID=58110 RepID=UPI003699E407